MRDGGGALYDVYLPGAWTGLPATWTCLTAAVLSGDGERTEPTFWLKVSTEDSEGAVYSPELSSSPSTDPRVRFK